MTNKPDVLDRAGGCLERLGNFALLMFLNLVWVGMALWGNYYFQNSRELTRNGVEVPGVVVDFRRTEDAEGEYFTPIFEYAFDGVTYRVEGGIASDPPQYRVGEAETLLVNPADPAQANVKSWGNLWGATAGLWAGAAIGALFSNGAAVLSLFRRKKSG